MNGLRTYSHDELQHRAATLGIHLGRAARALLGADDEEEAVIDLVRQRAHEAHDWILSTAGDITDAPDAWDDLSPTIRRRLATLALAAYAVTHGAGEEEGLGGAREGAWLAVAYEAEDLGGVLTEWAKNLPARVRAEGGPALVG